MFVFACLGICLFLLLFVVCFYGLLVVCLLFRLVGVVCFSCECFGFWDLFKFGCYNRYILCLLVIVVLLLT